MTNRKFGVDCCYVCGLFHNNILCKGKLFCNLCFKETEGGKKLFLKKIRGRLDRFYCNNMVFFHQLKWLTIFLAFSSGFILFLALIFTLFVNIDNETHRKELSTEQRFEILYKDCLKKTQNEDFCKTEAYRKVYIYNK